MLAHMRAARRGVDLQARAGALLLRGTPWQPPSRQKPTSWKRIGHEHSGQLSLQPDLQLQAQRIEVRHRSVLVAYCPKQARKNQTLHVSQKPLFLLRHRRDLASKGTKPAAGKQKNGELDAGKEENAKSATSAKEEPKSDAGIMEQAKSAAQERPENPKPRRRSRRKSAAAAKEEEAILATASTKESKSAAVAKEEAKSAAVAKEKAKSAAAAKEEAKSAAVAKEKAKSAAASTKESKSATVAKEEAKSAAATKENAKSAAAAKEEAKSATVAKEEAKSAAATKEKAKPAAAAKEEAKSAAASTKESKSAAVAKEESKSAATAKEEAKSAAAAKEEAKSAAAAKEKAKSAAASTKESKSATVAKEEAKSAAATKENAKSAAAAKEEAKSAAAAKEEAKSAAAAKEEAKPAAAAKEEANTSGKVASTAGKEASASQKNIWNDDVFGDFSSTLPIIKPSPICVLLEELKKTKSTIADLRQLVFAQVSSIDKQITHLADVEDRHLQNASVHYMDAILGKFQTPNHVAAPPSVQSATPTLVESRSESPEVANESSTPSPLSHFSSETPLKPSKSMPESPQRSLQRSPEARVDPRAPKAVVSGATASSSMLSWEVDSNGEPLAISPSTSGGFDVWTIETESAAHELMTRIKALPPDIAILGCDTEVIIDIKNTSPVGNGVVTCVSIAFPTLEDFTQVHTNENDLAKNFPSIANGEAKLRLPPKRLCAWIDVMGDGAQHDPMGLLKIIAPALEAKTSPRKVWHNYSFDRHVLFNHNVDCHGLAGDTMHMGRLTHNGRIEGYSLAALSQKFLETPDLGKTPMLDLFGRPKILASGKPGKSLELPPIDEIQVGEKRDQWIAYSCLDSVACLKLYFTFRQTLETMFIDKEESAVPKSLFQVYEENLLPFAHVLTEMEREGIQIDVEHLENIAVQSKADLEENMAAFRNWVRESDALVNPDDADNINLNSPKQRAALIHGPKSMGENADIIELPGLKKKTTVQFRGLGLPVIAQTATEQPKTGAGQLQALAGDVTRDPPRWGIAYETLEEKNPGAGEAACLGLSKLTTSLAIEKLIGTFIEPLIQRAKSDVERRVHTSLNFNTDTGRLSASNPNLQNQPALEKDIYKIRKAFTCRPGNRLIVADYGQLELRVLAHLANCKSMIDAFIAGGDFHSRTALSMFDHIANDKEVILEWDKAANGNEPPPYPLIKDKYASERRQAKVLNFSIAYGKTAFGLANDFGVSVDEAQAIVDRWYNARPEVREWQKETIEFCRDHGYVETIWGRRRPLEKINSSNTSLRRASERAAINTPIQGSAADIVMSAMNKLYANQAFRDLGWRMILQVHDEIIAEGPEESTKEAMEILRECMENPLDYVLGVDMIVDADAANDWYEAK